MTSEFVEGDDVDRLDFIFKLFDLLLDKVCRNFIIFHSGSDLNLEDTVCDGLLLPFGLPEETIHFNAKDLVSKYLKISVFSPWLNLPDNQGFGDWGSLLLLCLGFFGFLLQCCGRGGVSLGIIAKEIIHLVISGGRFLIKHH